MLWIAYEGLLGISDIARKSNGFGNAVLGKGEKYARRAEKVACVAEKHLYALADLKFLLIVMRNEKLDSADIATAKKIIRFIFMFLSSLLFLFEKASRCIVTDETSICSLLHAENLTRRQVTP